MQRLGTFLAAILSCCFHHHGVLSVGRGSAQTNNGDQDGRYEGEGTSAEEVRAKDLTSKEGHRVLEREVQILHTNNLEFISDLLKDPVGNSNFGSPWLQECLLFESRVTLLLALVYSEKCPECKDLVGQFLNDIPKLFRDSHNGTNFSAELPPPVLLLLSVDSDDFEKLAAQLGGLGIIQVPTLIWMIRDSLENAFVLEFVTTETPDELTPRNILETFQHLQTRLLLLSSAAAFDDDSSEFSIEPKYFAMKHDSGQVKNRTESTSHLEKWVLDHGLSIFQSTRQIFPGPLLAEEQAYIDSLWYDEGQNTHDGFLLLGQCRTKRDGNDSDAKILLDAYERLAGMWINRRDVAMLSISDCPNMELDVGTVIVWRLFLQDFVGQRMRLSLESAERIISVNPSDPNARTDFKKAVVQATTPSLLWLERERSTAVAFASWRRVHALLVIDVQRPASDAALSTAFAQQQRDVFREFRRLCREHQRSQFSEDVVCLVVPSTDIRTLTVFGIDIWTPMNLVMWHPEGNHPDPHILPVIIITDQRFGGTRRFYNDRRGLQEPEGLSTFWASFWEGKLTPFPKSSQTSRTNKAGIRIITSNDFYKEVYGRENAMETTEFSAVPGTTEDRKHALVLFTSPMCGHCRRLMSMWNQFGQLVQHLGWSSFLILYQMDVSVDEVLTSNIWNETIRWVPDLIYVSPENPSRTVRYEEEDDRGDYMVGGVRSYMDLVEWFLHTASLDNSQIVDLLTDVRKHLSDVKA